MAIFLIKKYLTFCAAFSIFRRGNTATLGWGLKRVLRDGGIYYEGKRMTRKQVTFSFSVCWPQFILPLLPCLQQLPLAPKLYMRVGNPCSPLRASSNRHRLTNRGNSPLAATFQAPGMPTIGGTILLGCSVVREVQAVVHKLQQKPASLWHSLPISFQVAQEWRAVTKLRKRIAEDSLLANIIRPQAEKVAGVYRGTTIHQPLVDHMGISRLTMLPTERKNEHGILHTLILRCMKLGSSRCKPNCIHQKRTKQSKTNLTESLHTCTVFITSTIYSNTSLFSSSWTHRWTRMGRALAKLKSHHSEKHNLD